MHSKDEKITLGIIVGIIVLVMMCNIALWLYFGTETYLKMVVEINKLPKLLWK